MTEQKNDDRSERVELIMHHGWGFDAGCWQGWREAAPESWVLVQADRGYTGNPHQVSSFSDNTTTRVAVVHSFGLHLMPETVLLKCDLLAIISSFQQFEVAAGKSIKRMRTKLESDSDGLFVSFYRNCFGQATAPPPPQQIDKQLLMQDLDCLEQNCLDVTPLKSIPRVLILHGELDTVVSPQQSELLHQLLPGSVLRVHSQSAHALSFTHADWCITQLKDALSSTQTRSVVCAEGRQ